MISIVRCFSHVMNIPGFVKLVSFCFPIIYMYIDNSDSQLKFWRFFFDFGIFRNGSLIISSMR